MDLVLQLLFTGVGIGAVYALVALGFVLIFRATNVVNFAQGEFSMVAAYLMVVFSVDQKRLVCLNADQDDLRWATAPRDELSRVVGLPQPVGEDRWLVTDLAGQVAIVDGETGQTGATKEVGLPGTVPEAAAVMVGEGRAIVPLSDGSVSVVEFPSPAPAAAPKEKE